MTTSPGRGAAAPHPKTGEIDWDAAGREATETLSAYVKIDSSHPAGRTTETATFLADRLSDAGIRSKIYQTPAEGKVNLVARLTAENAVGKPLLLSNHMDVVQAVAADWTFDPYSGEVANGYVYGRGALDMKGMGVMELLTMLQLKRQHVELARDVILLCTCDEEIGSTLGARWLVENHFDDFDPAFMLDEGGSGMRGFFSAGDVFDVVVGEKRILWLRMIARAEPGHGSMPWADTAPHRLIRAANAILQQVPEDRRHPVINEMIRRLGGEPAAQEIAAHRATRPLLHDTISLTMLTGGYKVNIIPEQAEVTFDCRLLPDTDVRSFISNLEQVVNDPNIRFETVQTDEGEEATAPWDNAPFRALEEACRAHVPAGTVTPGLCVGGTDARYFRARGVPSYGLVPGLYTAEDMKGFHGVDERLSVENLVLGSRIVYDFTLRAAARP